MSGTAGEDSVAMPRQSFTDERIVSSADGTPLWTIAEGDGPLTILLSSGGPGCPDYLAPLSALLASRDRRVVRWEQRGVGRSGGDPAGPFTIAGCVAAVVPPTTLPATATPPAFLIRR